MAIMLAGCGICLGQSRLTIEDCYQKARENFPLIKQYELIEKTKEYNVANAARGYLPRVTLSAQATYQSDVTEIPVDLESLGLGSIKIPTVSKDQYMARVEVSQTVWDGGTIRSAKERAKAEAEASRKELDVTLYAVNERVNQLYFGILLTEAQMKQLGVLQNELRSHCSKVEAYMRNGLANQGDLDALRVELLKAKQDEAQARHTRKAYVNMLARLIGEEISPGTTFVKPQAARPTTEEVRRPELAAFDARIRSLETANGRIKAGLMPKVGVFATGGYGRPGLDMLDDDFKAYYMAGVRLSWNIGGFYTKRNDRRNIENNIQAVETQRKAFLLNAAIDAEQRNGDIERYAEQLRYDDEIIALRGSVKRVSEAKMANGTLSGTDLTRDIHAEQSAILDKIRHEIEMLAAIYNLKYVINH